MIPGSWGCLEPDHYHTGTSLDISIPLSIPLDFLPPIILSCRLHGTNKHQHRGRDGRSIFSFTKLWWIQSNWHGNILVWNWVEELWLLTPRMQSSSLSTHHKMITRGPQRRLRRGQSPDRPAKIHTLTRLWQRGAGHYRQLNNSNLTTNKQFRHFAHFALQYHQQILHTITAWSLLI